MGRNTIHKTAKAEAQERPWRVSPTGKRKPKAAKPKAPEAKGCPKRKASQQKPWTNAEIEEAFRRLRAVNPEPRGELEHINPYTLLVAVVLSAQATDAGVNKATRAAVRAGRYAGKDGGARRSEAARLHQDHRAATTPRRRTSSRCRRSSSPSTAARCRAARAVLETLPGVGRKTANVVLNVAFGEETFAVDTHVFRVGNRTGMAPGKTPLEVELKLEKMVPPAYPRPRPSLADPARPLHLQGAAPAVREMPDQRSVPLAGKDDVHGDRA